MSTSTDADKKHLHRALKLAARAQGRVEPNPMVGCVIVKRGRVIGDGYHRRFGGSHAEIDALRRCETSPRGATVYVTLEPCCHEGKTPPCTAALIEAGVKRVVAPLKDPNPAMSGKGFARLRRARIRVDVGLLREEARELNAPFFKFTETARPWVILKWAQSLDGKIATHAADSKWISDEVCRGHAHRVRGRLDAIVLGIGTVFSDNPLLTCRAGRPRRVATRVILDSNLQTPPRSWLVRTARDVPTWIFCGATAPASRARRLESAGCVLHPVPRQRRGLRLSRVLDILGRHGMTNVLVEGGGRVLGSFFDQGLADEYHIYIAPLLIGGVAAPGPLGARGVRRVAGAMRVPETVRPERLGDGYFLRICV